MDPQKLSQLDPKLRDAYQRVMGTPIPQPQVTPASATLQRGEPIQAQTPPPPPPPTPAPTPTPTPPPPVAPVEPPIAPPTPPTQPNPISEPQSAIPTETPAIPIQPPAAQNNFVQMNSEVAAPPAATIAASPNFVEPVQVPTATLKKKNMMMPILIGIAGVIFIVVYTLFWTKLFNFKLPFLP